VIVLRRNQQLAGEVAQTEELIARREYELNSERELYRIKTIFVSTVSHEFRTPLGVIMSAAEVLKDYAARMNETRRQEHLVDIVDAARRMDELISEVPLLGRVESGLMHCSVKPVDLPSLCRKIIDSVVTATQQRCTVVLIEDGTLKGKVSLDESLVTIILSNLIANAVKYSPPGKSVHLALRLDDGRVVFEVGDEGIGIPAEDQSQLFRTFRRGGNVGDVPGTGLGLAIVKRCAELHAGVITFTSVEGAGSTFTVRLPLPPQV
jgi:signal transduction histidine kinase